MEKRIAKIFLDPEPGEHIGRAIQRAKNEGCDFICFNDRLYSTEIDTAWEEAPVVQASFLRDVADWRIRNADRIDEARIAAEIRAHR